jgi:hypothetical protein
MTSNERKQEILRRLTPEQRQKLYGYDQRHKEFMASTDKLRQWENMLMIFEEFFEVCKSVNIPIEPQIQHIVATWSEHIAKGGDTKQFENVLRQLAALADKPI